MRSKSQLRKEIEPLRKALKPEDISALSALVVKNFETLESFRTAKTVALYRAIAGEVNIDALFKTCWKLGKLTCIPVFNPASKTYKMTLVSAQTTYSTGHYGIKEPNSLIPIHIDKIDFITVPGVAFDPEGNRLGRGGGYYDCFLEGFSGTTAGVAFDFQVRPHVPVEAHDQPVDWVVTSTGIMTPKVKK